MYDPIGGFHRIREHYLNYLETAFRIADPVVSSARRDLLERPGELCTEPFIEPIPRYKTVDWSISDLLDSDTSLLPGLDDNARRLFGRLVPAGLFDRDDLSLYTHQAEMLERGLEPGTPGVVTSGTGSGKTEAFLLPILARLCDEAKGPTGWAAPEEGYLKGRWWHDENGKPYDKFTSIPKSRRPLKKNPDASPFVPHRVGETRDAAMRCLILYPMNALVEDQLARIRTALDSPAAREVLTDELDGNRIFFGRYTGQTPVTGYDGHPRLPSEDYRSIHARSVASLFQHSVEMERTQEWIRRKIREGNLEEGTRYLFPSTDGAELISRWDIQATPPDILISNISMLGAMLNREVDAPIFARTREWLETHDDAYFYLVLDELHLHRGTAGTEVAYLIRLLLHRLGLTSPEHAHKLRILASSASLPAEGEAGDKSLRYLIDMFGAHGTHLPDESARDSADWADAIVPGEAVHDEPETSVPIDAAPFRKVIHRLGGFDKKPVGATQLPDVGELNEVWDELSVTLGSAGSPGHERGAAVVKRAGELIAAGCWSPGDERHRATSVPGLAEALFGNPTETEAVRGLLAVRGLGDAWQSLYGESAPSPDAPSFRLHTFFRAIEGLYAPLDGSLSSPFGALSIERSYSTGGARPLDLLYCESCGVLLVGGRRSSSTGQGSNLELTPTADNLEELPDQSHTDRFEEQTFEGYALFYPTDSDIKPGTPNDTTEDWRRSLLDPFTGQIYMKPPQNASELVPGWTYRRKGNDRHKRGVDSAGTNVPYQCPSCTTDYSPRPSQKFRLSPIRHFRPGFAKTTQLLSTELFELLGVTSTQPKLISFSDSRQEAAKAALDIEGRHHEDLRRQVLFSALKAIAAGRLSTDEADDEIARLKEQATELLNDDLAAAAELLQRADELESAGSSDEGVVGPLSKVLPDYAGTDYIGLGEDGRKSIGSLLETYVDLGVHPFDASGAARIKAKVGDEEKSFDWPELFVRKHDDIDWRDRPWEQPLVDAARQTILEKGHKALTEVLFNRTYFAMEETGIGYPCLLGLDDAHGDDHDRESALLRVFADSYRLLDSQFDNPQPVYDADDFGPRSRIRQFAEAVWGNDRWKPPIDQFLGRLNVAGHPAGLIKTPQLHVRLVPQDALAWRCAACARVHLHRGIGKCTRCFKDLPTDQTITAGEIAEGNYVGRQTTRSSEPFRLHCEELTGQTDDGAERQRAFRNVLIQDLRPERNNAGEIRRDDDDEIVYADRESFWPEREEIDLLAVTTTMEVGIDIGSLQAVVQANMPPQRFNYQQRVGRAGRRGQAFSMALTVCRTKSHDLHYFRNPEAMTGDTPPPPFLARSRVEIAERFLWKFWLSTAFALLRSETDEWPADSMRPPDIHGEFVQTEIYKDDPDWPLRLSDALYRTRAEAETFAAVLTDNRSENPVAISTDPEPILAEIASQVGRQEVAKTGLAHTLAEGGMLPMYGMPTRVRDLYTGMSWSSGGRQWRTIDRDIDVAIHEFAPGSTIIKDKRSHLCVGFTGPLPPVRPGQKILSPFSEAFSPAFWMTECATCRSWYRANEEPRASKCSECSQELTDWAECREPLGFRTDFRPEIGQLDDKTRSRSRSVQAESFTVHPAAEPHTNALVQVKGRTRTYRMNRGRRLQDEDRWEGFTAERYEHLDGPPNRKMAIEDQWFDTETVSDSRIFSQDLVSQNDRVESIWLAAPKTTDILLLAPAQLADGLGLGLLERSRPLEGAEPGDQLAALQATAVRAAAVSASFIVCYRAAIELDVDPEEFDIIEPRMAFLGDRRVPVLQFADFLVNGAGLCSSLGEPGDGGTMVGAILRSAVEDHDHYPLKDFGTDEHRSRCGTACYICLLRHSNQSFHGLLDWRLGLAYVHALASPDYRCGIDGDWSSPALLDWSAIAAAAIKGLDRRLHGTLETKDAGALTAFRLPDGGRWTVVCHPLWDPFQPSGILEEALHEAGSGAVAIDSFSLSRRPWLARSVLAGLPDGEISLSPAATSHRGETLSEMLHSANLPEPQRDYPWAEYLLDYAWPDDDSGRGTCLLDLEDSARDRALTEEGWAIYAAGQERELVEYLAGR